MRPIAVLAAGLTLGIGLAISVAASPEAEPPAAPASAPGPTAVFPREWFFYGEDDRRLALLRRLDGLTAPELTVKQWLVGEPITMDALRGRIVLLDFWGTWCGPCLAALPHTNEIAKAYEDQGVSVIAICDDTKNADRAPAIVEQLKLTCRVAMDKNRATHKSFLGQWFPYYVLVDREGKVRASGLTSDAIGPAIDALLAEQPFGAAPAGAPADAPPPAPAAPANSPAPDAPASSWLEGTPAQRQPFGALEGRAPGALAVASWINAEPMDLGALKGKVVLLDFWGTWCKPCLESVPHMNAMAERYEDAGLVVIGVCHPKNADQMAATAQKYGIAYPIASDTGGATFKAYHVNGTPDYYLIDRAGVLRFADVANAHVEDAIRLLLAEPAPGTAAPAH